MKWNNANRMIDFKVPLPYLISSLAGLSIFLFTLHADVRQLLRDVSKMQATAEAGNAKLSTITSEQALQRYRIDSLESDLHALKGNLKSATVNKKSEGRNAAIHH